MKWYKHLFIYLGCIAFTEAIIALLFWAEQINGHDIWYAFAWIQFAIPIGAFLIPFLMVEALISADKERQIQVQLHEEIIKMLKEKKENKDE